MIINKSVSAVVLAAGNSLRFGTGKNKNFEKINGREIISFSLLEFDWNNYIDDIVIVTRENDVTMMKNLVDELKLKKRIKIITGGDTRSKSVYNALIEINSDIVIIHDGARPFIKQSYINDCINKVLEYDAVTIGTKSKDTVKIVNDNNIVIDTTNREKTWIVQTPQSFKREKLLEAMKQVVIDNSITDDCSIMERSNYNVKIIEGDYMNIKITTYEDYLYACFLIRENIFLKRKRRREFYVMNVLFICTKKLDLR